jgi:hypothetical protein
MQMAKEEILHAIVNYFSEYPQANLSLNSVDSNFFISDENYQSIGKKDVENILHYRKPKFTYNPANEIADCDDFALYAKCTITSWYRELGNSLPPAIGIIYDTYHAFNVFIDMNGSEPEVFFVDSTKSPAKAVSKHSDVLNNIVKGFPIRMVYF